MNEYRFKLSAVLCALYTFFLIGTVPINAFEVDYSKFQADKMRFEQELESKTQNVLNKIVGEGNSQVVINVEFSFSKEETTQSRVEGENKEARKPFLSTPEGDKGFFLPGIPLKSPDVPSAPKELPMISKDNQEATKSKTTIDPTLIKKIGVTIVVDQAVKARTVDIIRSAVTKALALNMERGDELFIEKAPFTAPGSIFDFVKKPLTWVIAAILIIFSLIFYFLIGPLKYMLSSFLDTWKAIKTGVSPEDIKKQKEMEESAELEKKALEEALQQQPQMAAGGGGGMAAMSARGGLPGDIFDIPEGEKPEEEKTEEEKKEGDEEMAEEKKEEGMIEGEKPAEELAAITEETKAGAKEEGEIEPRIPSFDFIKEDQIKRLAYLLQVKGADFTVAVLNFLKPDIAQKVVFSFPPSYLVKVSKSLMQVKQITRAQLKQLKDDIEKKIDFVIGGLDYLIDILNQAPKSVRDKVITGLREENPALADRISGMIFTFDSILNVPNISIQTLLQQDIKMDIVATALRGSSDDIRNKFTSNMTEGMMTHLKEEMEFGRPTTARMIEEAQKTIIDTLRKLEREGKIVMVEGEVQASYDDVSEYGEIILGRELEEMEEASRAAKTDSYEQAVAAYSAGRYEEAVNLFNEAIAQGKTSAELYQYMGSSLYSLGREEESFTAFDKSLELNPGNDELRGWLSAIPSYSTRASV